MDYVGWGTYHNSMSFSNHKGESATFPFEGTGISYIASRESNRGIAEIFLDGVSQGRFDLYSPEILRQQTIFEAKGLPEGKHTLRVVVTGDKNPKATDRHMDLDALVVWGRLSNRAEQKVDDQDNDLLHYSSSGWQQVAFGGQNAYKDTISFSRRKGDFCEFKFEGNSISYIACTEPNRGIAEIFIDGISYGEFDCYAPTMLRQQTVFTIDNLSEGEHTIRVEVTGKKNPAATDCYIDIDAFACSYRLISLESVPELVHLESPQAARAVSSRVSSSAAMKSFLILLIFGTSPFSSDSVGAGSV